jgi:hypothetical protein
MTLPCVLIPTGTPPNWKTWSEKVVIVFSFLR